MWLFAPDLDLRARLQSAAYKSYAGASNCESVWEWEWDLGGFLSSYQLLQKAQQSRLPGTDTLKRVWFDVQAPQSRSQQWMVWLTWRYPVAHSLAPPWSCPKEGCPGLEVPTQEAITRYQKHHWPVCMSFCILHCGSDVFLCMCGSWSAQFFANVWA